MVLKQTCSWSLRRQTFAICIPLSPVITFFSEKFYIILKSSETQSYKSKSLFLITLLLHFWLYIIGLISVVVGNYFANLTTLIAWQNKSSYHALFTHSKICEMTNDVINVQSSSPDLGPLGPSLSWWRRCTGKKVNRYFSAETNVQADTSSNRRLPSPFITEARSVSVPGPVP